MPSTIPTATLASRSRCAGSLGLARGAIDTFDIAAHLEASGVGDRAAQRLGHVDVFAWAADLITTEPDPAPAATRTARRERRTASRVTLPPDPTASIPASMFRVTTLLAGMALCAVVLAGHTTSTTDTLLGLSSTAVLGSGGCWLVSHAVSAAVWHDRGLGDGRIGRSAVVPLALGLLLAVAISIFDPAAAWWIGYGAASGVVIARQDSWRIALSAVGVALLSLLAHLLAPAVGGLLARGAVVVAVVAAVAMVSTARPTGRDVTDPAAWAVIASATLQTCAQVGALFCLLGMVPAEQRMPAGAGALLMAILADPMLTAARAMRRRITAIDVGPMLARLRLRRVWLAQVVVTGGAGVLVTTGLGGGIQAAGMVVATSYLGLSVGSWMRVGDSLLACAHARLGFAVSAGLAIAVGHGEVQSALAAPLVATSLGLAATLTTVRSVTGRPAGWL